MGIFSLILLDCRQQCLLSNFIGHLFATISEMSTGNRFVSISLLQIFFNFVFLLSAETTNNEIRTSNSTETLTETYSHRLPRRRISISLAVGPSSSTSLTIPSSFAPSSHSSSSSTSSSTSASSMMNPPKRSFFFFFLLGRSSSSSSSYSSESRSSPSGSSSSSTSSSSVGWRKIWLIGRNQEKSFKRAAYVIYGVGLEHQSRIQNQPMLIGNEIGKRNEKVI